MRPHVAHIFVEEFENEQCHVVLPRAVYGFEEFAADSWQLEVQEIVVAAAQVVHQGFDRHVLDGIGRAVTHEIGNCQESGRVHACRLAYLAHRFFAHAEGNAEAAHHL